MKISPLFNRGILFLSDRLLHYTLPPTREGATFGRWLLTIWLEGDSVDAPLGQRWPPLLQRTLAPAIYSKVFLSSLERSMPPGPALDALKAAQEEEITSLESDETFGEMLPDLREAALDAIASNRKRKSSGDQPPCEKRPLGASQPVTGGVGTVSVLRHELRQGELRLHPSAKSESHPEVVWLHCRAPQKCTTTSFRTNMVMPWSSLFHPFSEP